MRVYNRILNSDVNNIVVSWLLGFISFIHFHRCNVNTLGALHLFVNRLLKPVTLNVFIQIITDHSRNSAFHSFRLQCLSCAAPRFLFLHETGFYKITSDMR